MRVLLPVEYLGRDRPIIKPFFDFRDKRTISAARAAGAAIVSEERPL
jgi:hypothetical protein